jgi:predicted DNA binding CopG/RHH family protein
LGSNKLLELVEFIELRKLIVYGKNGKIISIRQERLQERRETFMKKTAHEIIDYDENDTTAFIDRNHPLSLQALGFKLPKEKPTKVISIRLPTDLYNKLKAYSTNMDIPYQAYIKYLLNKGIKEDSPKKKKSCGVR